MEFDLATVRRCAGEVVELAGHRLADVGGNLSRLGAGLGIPEGSVRDELGLPGTLKGCGHMLVLLAGQIRPDDQDKRIDL